MTGSPTDTPTKFKTWAKLIALVVTSGIATLAMLFIVYLVLLVVALIGGVLADISHL